MANLPTQPTSRLRAFLNSFGYAFAGLWHVVKTQRNMRVHLCAAAAAVALGIYVGLGRTQWAVLALTIGLVLVTEMFNTVAEAAMDATAVRIRGLMTIAPLATAKETRPCFRRMRKLRDELVRDYAAPGLDILSMGMTQDFEVALEEGANMVRIGTAIFAT